MADRSAGDDALKAPSREFALMIGLSRQAGILAFARFANYGLMLISPIILVRLLPVEQFGQYREFVLYASFLSLFAAFSFNDSLLYFIPTNNGSPSRVVNQTNFLTACSSIGIITAVAIFDYASHGKLVGHFLVPLAFYVLLFVNVDFWESYLLVTHRPGLLFAYSGVRLMARMLVVIVAALFTTDVGRIVWSLVLLEAVRMAGSLLFWRKLNKSSEEAPLHGLLSKQLRYCLPTGLGMILYMANRNMGNLAVAKVMGAVSLAHYAIGTYGEYFYLAIGNSIAAVLLPEMVRRDVAEKGRGLWLWQRATVVYCILLFPVAILVARYAEPLIITVFSERYRPAIIVLQIHMLFLIRGCLDFSPALRAIDRTRPLIYSNSAALVCNAICLYWLLPLVGIAGAVASLVISSVVEALVLGWCTAEAYATPGSRLVPWAGVGKVAGAAAIACLLIAPSAWTELMGLSGMVLGSICFAVAFVLLLRVFKVAEAEFILQKLRVPLRGMMNGLQKRISADH